MHDLDAILREYAAEHERAGTPPDPAAYLRRVSVEERPALRARIEAHLSAAPRRAFDPAAFEASLSTPLMQGIAAAAQGSAGLWPALLPRLRNAAHLKRSEVVDELARALGVADRRDKVHGYYHEMEQGRLDPDGVSDRVLDALGRILGATAGSLRESGRALGSAAMPQDPGTGPVFARATIPDPTYGAPPAAASAPPPAEEWDEVDELFRGATG